MKRQLFALALGTLLAVGWAFPVTFAEEAKALSSGVVAIDIPESRAGLVSLEIQDGHFSQYNVGKIHLDLHNIDFRQGTLGQLAAVLTKGDFDPIQIDQMTINTYAFQFNTFELINHQRFELAEPINGNVSLQISEASLNHFIRHPKTLDKLERAIMKKTGGIKLLTFANPSIRLLKDNQVQVDIVTIAGGGVQIPMQMQGQLAIRDGNLVFSNLRLASDATQVELPIDVVKLLEKQLNDLINLEKLGKQHFVIHANSLKMKKGMIEVGGTASFTRLEFGG